MREITAIILDYMTQSANAKAVFVTETKIICE